MNYQFRDVYSLIHGEDIRTLFQDKTSLKTSGYSSYPDSSFTTLRANSVLVSRFAGLESDAIVS